MPLRPRCCLECPCGPLLPDGLRHWRTEMSTRHEWDIMRVSLRPSQALHVKYVINMEMYRGKSIWAVAWIQIKSRFSFNCSVSGDFRAFFFPLPPNFCYSIHYQETGPFFCEKKLKNFKGKKRLIYFIFLVGLILIKQLL